MSDIRHMFCYTRSHSYELFWSGTCKSFNPYRSGSRGPGPSRVRLDSGVRGVRRSGIAGWARNAPTYTHAAGRGDAPACCHHDAANYSYDLLLLTTVIDYVRTNARKPSAMIRKHFRPHRHDHGRRALDGHLQAAGARRVRRQSGRSEAPRLPAERLREACGPAE